MNEHERQYLKEQKNSKASSPAIFVDSLEYLANLRERYANVRLPIANHSVWQSRGTNQNTADIGWIKVDLQNFRENNAYVFSYLRNDPLVSRLTYFIFADAVRLKDASGLLKKLTEDGAFGCQTCEYPGIGRVSRDLLDSVLEINFLQKHLRILDRDDLNILDIGAGYGRMAHRIMTANPKLQSYTCVDAIPESTFLSEFYLKHRGLANNTRVIPLDEVDQTLAKPGSYDLALNIHSFSECTYAAVEWWLSRIAQLRVKHLMIIPNESEEFLTVEQDRSRRDFRPLIEELGFKLIAKESVFDDPAVRELMNVNDYMFLFELNLT
jgi:hypothetical protein